MSFWIGISSWFNRQKKQPFLEVINDLERINKDSINILLSADKQKKYRFRKKLERANSHINDFSKRLDKVQGNKELMKLILIRKPKTANDFFPKARAIIFNFYHTYELLRKESLQNKDIIEIENKIKKLIATLQELKILTAEIEYSLLPRRFNKSKALDPFHASGNTTDGISLSKIIRVADGFSIPVREANSHTWTLDLQDGQPCALGETTSFTRHVKNRIARAVGRKPQEIDAILRTL